jgi:predicted enzyme related to lactoylglutathione lyase
MLAGIQGLGWLVRRTDDPEGLAAFYRDVIGLPVLRTHGATTVFWCGETVVMGINSGGRPQPRYTDRGEAPFMPIFRVRSMERTRARLAESGVEFVNEPFDIGGGEGILAYLRDPGGHITGLQERTDSAQRPQDIEWRRRQEAGELAVPGAPDLDGEIAGLGWIVVRCTDLDAQLAFYRDTLGFEVMMAGERAALLTLGGTLTLEIALGSPPQPVPTDRAEVPDTFLLRVDDSDALAARLEAAGVRRVGAAHRTEDGGGAIHYLLDPENHLFGIQTRTPASERVEDTEARRRRALGPIVT